MLQSRIDPNNRILPIFEDKLLDKVLSKNAVRLIDITLPFFSLYRPTAVISSLLLGGYKTWSCLSEKGYSPQKYLQATYVISSVVFSIILPKVGVVASHGLTIFIDLANVATSLKDGEFKQAGKTAIKVVHASLYVFSVVYCTPYIVTLSLLNQAAVELYEAHKELKNKHWPETVAKVLMASFRIYQAASIMKPIYLEWSRAKTAPKQIVVTIDTLKDLEAHLKDLDKDALVLVDIDETMIKAPNQLGGVHWREWVKRLVPKKGANFAIYDALTLYIAQHAPYKTVEGNTAQIIADLQARGVSVFACTSRGQATWYSTNIPGVDQFTQEQLNRVGIDFRKTQIPESLQKLDGQYFKDGIIFVDHISKGELLERIFGGLGYRPSSLVFIDDKLTEVQSIENTAKQWNIPFRGFCYTRAKIDGADFDPQVTNVQLEYLLLRNEPLSDEAARKIASQMPKRDPGEHFQEILQRCDLNAIRPSFEKVSQSNY